MKKLCKCGCGKEIIIKYHHRYYGTPSYVQGHQNIGRTKTDEWKKNMSISKKGKETWIGRLKRENYDKFLEHQKKAGKKGVEACRKKKVNCFFDKKLQSKGGRIAHQKHDYGIIFRKAIDDWKKRDYKGYIEHQRKASKKSLELHPELHYNFGNNWGSLGGKISAKNPENIKRKTEILLKYIKSPKFKVDIIKHLENIRKNKRHYFNGIYFSSKEELKVAKKILEYELETKLIKGKNCHIIIKTNNSFREIDFFIQNKIFIEYHSYDLQGLSDEEYYNKRRKILDDNGFSDKQLIVLKSIDDFEKQIVRCF